MSSAGKGGGRDYWKSPETADLVVCWGVQKSAGCSLYCEHCLFVKHTTCMSSYEMLRLNVDFALLLPEKFNITHHSKPVTRHVHSH